MSLRLVVITEIISPYRIPVFNALARYPGIDLHVIFLAETDITTRRWLVYKEEIRFSYEVLPSWRRRIAGRNLLLNWGLTKALHRASPAAILCGGYNYLASWRAARWARKRRIPFLVWIESTVKDRRNGHFLIEFLKMRFVRDCAGVVVPGKSSSAYAAILGVPAQKIFVAPNAVDNELFAKEADLAGQMDSTLRRKLQLPDRFFLFVGRLVPEKGVFDLVEAYGKLSSQVRSEVGLVFAGDGRSRSKLEQQVIATGPGTIMFAGFVHREELARYYGLAEALVLPTHSDPWGLVVNEAMACGLPVIVTDAAGCAADLVTDNWNGRVVPAGNSQRLSSAMQELISDHELRRLMAHRSRGRITQYSPEACAAGIAQAALSYAGRIS